MKPAGRTALLLAASLAAPVAASAQEAARADAAPTEADALRQARTVLEPRLSDVLERAPANQAVPWRDDASGLSGDIVAAPATFDGKPCRALRYTVRGGSKDIAVEGRRCREPDGQWLVGRVANSVMVSPLASPLIRDLEVALRRLAYYRGSIDGIATMEFARAVLAFEHDEQVPPDAVATAGLLGLAAAATARIPDGGGCGTDQPVPGVSVACGSVR